jgi:hypothetical protein
MPAFDDHRLESFAQCLAKGMRPLNASRRTGFAADANRSNVRAARADVVKRVAEIAQSNLWGGSRDLGPVIDELMAAAQEARKLGTGAGMMAARALLVEAARLKEELPVPLQPGDRELTREEWTARHAPHLFGDL